MKECVCEDVLVRSVLDQLRNNKEAFYSEEFNLFLSEFRNGLDDCSAWIKHCSREFFLENLGKNDTGRRR